MNPHPRLPLVSTTLLICLLTGVSPVHAQQPGTAGLYEHTATLLANGQVLVVGGNKGNYYTPTASTELYNPATGQWSLTGSLSTPRSTGSTATVGGLSVPVYGFAPVTGYPGLDVVNIGPLPRALAGRGEVDVAFSLDGKNANRVSVNIP